MDHYGNDMYLSQDGYPSLDFTLLDRPSSRVVSARESVIPFSQGNPSFPSFNGFDGSGALAYNDRMITDHGNYVVEAHKNVVRRHPSGAFVSISNQSEGVRDFFDQGNQPQKSDPGTWLRNEQSAHFVNRASISDESAQRAFHSKNSYEAASDSHLIEWTGSEARMLHPSVGFSKSMAGKVADRSKLSNVSLTAQHEHRNQALSAQGVLNVPASNYFGPITPFKSAMPSHQPTAHMSFVGAQSQKQCYNYDVSNQTGGVVQSAPSYDFFGNQVSQEEAIQHSQAEASKQLQHFTKPNRPPEIQSQQLQDMFVAPQFKQLEGYRQELLFQQAPSQFSRTSYSELLHGPDTPPSQCQTMDEYEIQASDLPTQNVEAVGWSVNVPSYGQAVGSDLGMAHNQNLALDVSAFGEGVASGSYSGISKDQNEARNGPILASYLVGQNFVPEHTGSIWKSPSSQQTGKPVLQSSHSGSHYLSEMQTTDHGLGHDWNNEQRKANQPHGKLGAAHNPPDDSVLIQKGKCLSQASIFSQSQQHFQELQFTEQRKFYSEPKQPVLNPNLSFTAQSLNPAKTTAKNGICSTNNIDTNNNFVGFISQNAASAPLDVAAVSGQLQWLTSSSVGSPSRPMSHAGVREHQTNSCEGLQHPSRGTGFHLQPAPDTGYNNPCNNVQQLSQQVCPVLGALPGPLDTPVIRQQGLYNIHVGSMDVKTTNAGSGSVFNQQLDMSLHYRQKQGGGAHVSDCRSEPVSEPASQFQGVWKKYTPPNYFPPGGGSLGQQSLNGLRPKHGFQPQDYLNSEAPFHTAAIPHGPNNNSAQSSSNQLVCEEQFSFRNSQSLERHISADQTMNQPTANFMKSLSRQAMKVVPDVTEDIQGGLHKFVEPQDLLVERQREVPQQQANACTANVSLAHLRGNHSSSSLSPQHVRLGLGPSHDLQQQSDASFRSFSHTHSLTGEVPILRAAQKTLPVEPPQRAVPEMNRRGHIEAQESSAAMKRILVQSNAAMSSVCVNSPPPALRETASSDTSPTSSFASGHLMGGTSIVSASTSPYFHEYNTGREPPQTVDKVRCDSSLVISRAHTSPVNFVSHQEALNGYSGRTSSFSEFSRQTNQSANGPSIQKNHLVESSAQIRKDNVPMHAMQDYDLNNKVGNRRNALNFKVLANASKESMLEQSKLMVNNEQTFSGFVESSQIPSSSGRLGNVGEQKIDTMQRSPMMMNIDQRAEEHQVSSMQSTVNDQLKGYRVAQASNEVPGSMPSTSFSSIQGERRHLSENSGLSSSLQAGLPSQDSKKYQHAKSFNSHTSETIGKNSRKPPLRAPSSIIGGQGVQSPSHEDLRQWQNLGGPEPSARVGRSSESAGIPLPESNKRPFKSVKTTAEPVRSADWQANQHAANVQLLSKADQGSRLDALEQYNVFESDSMAHRISQPVGTVGHLPLPKGSVKSDQTVPYPTNINHLTSPSVGFKNVMVPASVKPPINKENQGLLTDNQAPLGLETLTSKELTPVLMPKNGGPLSPLKAIIPQEEAPPSKKRKKRLPLLIPWHIAAVEPSVNPPSISDAELAWASALNRLSEKDFNATHDDNTSTGFRAKRRLILTTESMQRLFPPLPDGMMHGKTPVETECGIFSLSKLALEDACRMVTSTNEQAAVALTGPSTMNESSQGQVCGIAENSMLTKCVESFMERVKHLGMELARLDCSTSVSELQGETHELEKLSIVNRLAKHHGIGFTMDTSDNLFIENIFAFGPGARRPPPQKYVTAVPIPRTLPEGISCLSL